MSACIMSPEYMCIFSYISETCFLNKFMCLYKFIEKGLHKYIYSAFEMTLFIMNDVEVC